MIKKVIALFLINPSIVIIGGCIHRAGIIYFRIKDMLISDIGAFICLNCITANFLSGVVWINKVIINLLIGRKPCRYEEITIVIERVNKF